MAHGRPHQFLSPAVATLMTACPIGQAADDFFDHHGDTSSGPGASTGGSTAASTEASTAASTTSTSNAEASSGSGAVSTESSASGSSSTSEAEETASISESDTTDEASAATGLSTLCGDGAIEGDEECDDGNTDALDDCDNDCAKPWTIFVTSGPSYTGNLNGLAGADTRCQMRANLGGQPRWDHYRALLSDSHTDAAERLHHARGYYRLVNGLPVAHGWEALMSAPLENPVNVSEFGETLIVPVWTGTQPGGAKIPGATHCSDWKDADEISGYFGESSEVGPNWLREPLAKVNPTWCGGNLALYCVEQP